jgi:hypothetical protein
LYHTGKNLYFLHRASSLRCTKQLFKELVIPGHLHFDEHSHADTQKFLNAVLLFLTRTQTGTDFVKTHLSECACIEEKHQRAFRLVLYGVLDDDKIRTEICSRLLTDETAADVDFEIGSMYVAL